MATRHGRPFAAPFDGNVEASLRALTEQYVAVAAEERFVDEEQRIAYTEAARTMVRLHYVESPRTRRVKGWVSVQIKRAAVRMPLLKPLTRWWSRYLWWSRGGMPDQIRARLLAAFPLADRNVI